MAIFQALRSCTRSFLKGLIKLLLISLPLTSLPALVAIHDGVAFNFWMSDQITKNIESLETEMELSSWRHYVSVPGAPSFNSFLDQGGPFHIPHLNSGDFLEKLDLVRPIEHQLRSDGDGFDKAARLQGLVRVESDEVGEIQPDTYWIYVTSFPRFLWNPWDIAFDLLLQQLYVNPLPVNQDIFYLDCSKSGFLCGIWNVRAQSLLQIKVDEQTLAEKQGKEQDPEDWLQALVQQEFTYDCPTDRIKPTSIKIVELGLSSYLAQNILPPRLFPDRLLQLRALILDTDANSAASNFEDYDEENQLIRRFTDHVSDLSNKKNTIYGRLSRADKWYEHTVLKPLLAIVSEDIPDMIYAGVFLTTAATATIVRIPFTLAWKLYTWYFDLTWGGSPADHTVPGEEPEPHTMWDDMLSAFWDTVARNLSQKANEEASEAAVTSRRDTP